MRRLLGVLITVCLVLQPLLVPLHLALEDHAHGAAGAAVVGVDHSAHAHSHAHGHPHAHPHVHPHAPSTDEGRPAAEADGDGHPSHPIEDHLDEQRDQLFAASASQVDAPAALPAGTSVDWPLNAVVRPAVVPARVRYRPPARAPVQPRAPPAIV